MDGFTDGLGSHGTDSSPLNSPLFGEYVFFPTTERKTLRRNKIIGGAMRKNTGIFCMNPYEIDSIEMGHIFLAVYTWVFPK